MIHDDTTFCKPERYLYQWLRIKKSPESGAIPSCPRLSWFTSVYSPTSSRLRVWWCVCVCTGFLFHDNPKTPAILANLWVLDNPSLGVQKCDEDLMFPPEVILLNRRVRSETTWNDHLFGCRLWMVVGPWLGKPLALIGYDWFISVHSRIFNIFMRHCLKFLWRNLNISGGAVCASHPSVVRAPRARVIQMKQPEPWMLSFGM